MADMPPSPADLVLHCTVGEIPKGDEPIDFERMRGPSTTESTYLERQPINLFEGGLLSVIVELDGVPTRTGTAVMIGPGIAASATHLFQRERDGRFGREYHDLDEPAYLVSVINDEPLVWEITSAHSRETCDLCLLMIRPRFDMTKRRTIKYFAIDCRDPDLGEIVLMAGLPLPIEMLEAGDVENLAMTPSFSSGPVTDIWPEGRGGPPPCFGVEMENRGGFSGGPVFDRRGMLIGILSRGFMGHATVSSIWFIFAIEVAPIWPSGLYPAGPVPLLDIEHFPARRKPRMRLIRQGDTVQVARWTP